LIERDLTEPDRIVGELLQPGGVRALEQLGLRDCLDDIDAITVQGYAVFAESNQKSVHLPYPPRPADDIGPVLQGKQSQSGTFESTFEYGKSFHHGRFIMKLREACRRQKK
jgi:squalene monooxygenase